MNQSSGNDFFDNEITPPDPESDNQQANPLTKLIIRVILFLFSAIICGYLIFSIREDLSYFFNGEPADLGNLKERYAKGERNIVLEHNSYLKFSNAIITFRSKSDDKKFFYCPLFHFLIQTEKELPNKIEGGTPEVHKGLLDLLYSHKVKPEELLLSFEGEGRVLSSVWFQNRFPRLYEFYHDVIGKENVYFFMDGETPDKYYPFLLAAIIGFAALVFSIVMLVKTVKRVEELRVND